MPVVGCLCGSGGPAGKNRPVYDNATSKSILTVHSHPFNRIPSPSPMDLLNLAHHATDSDMKYYAGSVVYCDSRQCFYTLLITDREKAANFYKVIKNEVDSTTNDFKRGGNIYKLIRHSNSLYKNYDSTYYLLAALSSVIEKYDAGVSIIKTTLTGGLKNCVYGVVRIIDDKKKEKYQPIKCE